jgi:hypothetical protein
MVTMAALEYLDLARPRHCQGGVAPFLYCSCAFGKSEGSCGKGVWKQS